MNTKSNSNAGSGCSGTTCSALWESIETAPKNGTEILVWREDAGTMLARWIAPSEFMTEKELEDWSDDDARESDWFYADFIAGGRLDDPPTHWMPLPSMQNVEARHPLLGEPLRFKVKFVATFRLQLGAGSGLLSAGLLCFFVLSGDHREFRRKSKQSSRILGIDI